MLNIEIICFGQSVNFHCYRVTRRLNYKRNRLLKMGRLNYKRNRLFKMEVTQVKKNNVSVATNVARHLNQTRPETTAPAANN